MKAKVLGLTTAEVRDVNMPAQALLEALHKLQEAWWYGGYQYRARPHVIMAIKSVMATAELQEHRDLALKVLKHGLDPEVALQLVNSIYPMPWGKT